MKLKNALEFLDLTMERMKKMTELMAHLASVERNYGHFQRTLGEQMNLTLRLILKTKDLITACTLQMKFTKDVKSKVNFMIE